MKKQPSESFKEYAQRWRGMAARLPQPMLEKDLTYVFINTLNEPYFKHLLANTSASFANIVVAGGRIEEAIQFGRLEGLDQLGKNSISPNPFSRGQEGTVNVVSLEHQSAKSHLNGPNVLNNGPTLRQDGQGLKKPRRKLTQIPIPMSQVYSHLKGENLLHPKALMSGYKPQKYDHQAQCEYHMG